jgi:biopolymer transport protein ExbB
MKMASRFALFFAAVTVVLVAWTFLADGPVQAQDPAPAAGSSGGDAGTTTTETKEEPNIFIHIIKSAGWVFGPIFLVMSVLMVALIVLLALEMRMGSAIPPGFVEDFTETVNQRQFKAAFDMAREDSSFLGVVLTSSMSRLQYGIEDAREAAINAVQSVKSSKEQLVTYLGTIGTVGPMVGLLGTVFGMIGAFMKLGTDKNVNAEKLAGDIAVALVTTLLGVVIAVPAIFCHAMFRNRLARISTDTSNIADDLLTQMYHNSRKAAPAAPTQGAGGQEIRAR